MDKLLSDYNVFSQNWDYKFQEQVEAMLSE